MSLQYYLMIYLFLKLEYLSKKFSDLMQNYNLIQAKYRDDCKARIKRQLEISNFANFIS